MKVEKKNQLRQLRRWRTRKRVIGSAVRPRMSVRFTGQHIYVQFIDDSIGNTLAAVSTRAKGVAGDGVKLAANAVSAKRIGGLAAEAAKSKGITAVVFDRSGSRFHGKIKALADAAREGGLQF